MVTLVEEGGDGGGPQKEGLILDYSFFGVAAIFDWKKLLELAFQDIGEKKEEVEWSKR